METQRCGVRVKWRFPVLVCLRACNSLSSNCERVLSSLSHYVDFVIVSGLKLECVSIYDYVDRRVSAYWHGWA